MNDNKVSEVTKTPRFILVLFFIQLFVFIFFLNKENKMDLEIFYILIPVTLLLTLSFLKVVFKKVKWFKRPEQAHTYSSQTRNFDRGR